MFVISIRIDHPPNVYKTQSHARQPVNTDQIIASEQTDNMSASIAYYRYPYFWLDYGVTDYPLTRRMLLSSPAAAEAQRLRNIDWRIR